MNRIATVACATLLSCAAAFAGTQDHANHTGSNMFMQEAVINGYKVTYHVMPATKDMPMGGSHNFMVKIQQGKSLPEFSVNSKVIFPDKKDQSKMMVRMGDWYMAGYDLGKPGKHQLMILFKGADGKKHSGGVYYP